ncbi:MULTISPECIES: type VII toxin-antitoxin system MntA family adenylyltransferase antitoxin [Leptolyngbya]|uniref:type VII toxin-antitoxin system MntA family adenylyltransferase antitoxin n=1 Tax=Leptolyngbya TaxID=47251 RepID=UPI0016825C84|nr:nucleotidyltransferase domain-containing protein [Leptolyngbya sp. FACHB-1624]MBD1856178.1 nucleotidyltransferase domain-containing protein [Leptolyngbya sp. FACHB-1624]
MKTKIDLLLDTLADGDWHSSHELSERIGWRFGSLLHEVRKQGHSIQTERIGLQYRYRRISENPPIHTSDSSELQLVITPIPQQVPHTNLTIDLPSAVSKIVGQLPYLRLLVLFGSRARGDNRENSDWDLAILCDEEQRKHYEKEGWGFKSWVVIQQVLQLPDDKIDIVDLGSCSDLMAHIVAHEGQLLYERSEGEFANFRQKMLKSASELRRLEQEERSLLELELRQWEV